MTPNTGQRKGLLASARGTKEPKRTPKYRRGGVANSGASLQPRRPDPEAGKAERETAKFLGQMNEFLFGKGMVVDQAVKSEKERGIAEFEKATAEQREGFRDAITNGWIDSKENPYFREGVTVSYTKNLLTKTSLDLYTEYEKWEGKNDPNSGAFEKWLETQDEKIAINLESIPDSILANNFYEPHQAIKRQLAQQHAGYLNKEYRDKANAEVDLRFNGLIRQYSQAMGLDLGSDPDRKVTDVLKEQGITQEQAWRIGGLLKTVPKSGDNVGIMPKESLRQLELMAKNEGGIAADTLYNYNGTEVDDLRAFEDAGLAWDDTPQGQAIASASQNITPEADANTLGEFYRSYSEQNLVKDYEQVLQQQAEDFKNVLAVTATIPEEEMRDDTGLTHGREYVSGNRTFVYKEGEGMVPKINPSFGDSSRDISIPNRDPSNMRVSQLTTSMKKQLNSDTTAIAKTMKVVTDTAIKNINLGAKDKDGKYVVAGGNSETMVNRVMQEGMNSGAHADWFVQLNKTMPKETLLAISHDFFDEHHAGLLNKKKGAWKGRRTVTNDFKKTQVNTTAFVSFVNNHPLNKGS